MPFTISDKCIGCSVCKKICPADAITLQDNRPVIDYAACTSCGLCIEKCPRKIILSATTEGTPA